ncbi:MAG: major capsid protein [Eubacteriales bacterium]|nr:major capsid protein [Eubacteriales bacterium]
MPLDIYSTAAQLKAIELMPPEYTFLYDTFAKDAGTVEDTEAIYDFRKGVKQMAPIVVPGTGGVAMARSGYETRRIGFCTVAPERIINATDIVKRAFGENVLGAMTPEQREKKLLAEDMVEMRKAIQRRREHMARMVLLTGKLDVFRYTSEGRDKETLLVADYGFTNVYTPATAWDEATAKIDYDMHKMYDLVYDGLGYVDIIVMAPDVADAMLENAKYVKQFDSKNIDMGAINTKYRGQGVRFIGWNSDGAEMYSFSGKFLDEDGTMKYVLPSGTVIMGGRGVLNCPHGPVMQTSGYGEEMIIKYYIKKEVPFRIGNADTNVIKNRLTSSPTIVPFNVDAWAVGNVL